jgi:hypothetical protein
MDELVFDRRQAPDLQLRLAPAAEPFALASSIPATSTNLIGATDEGCALVAVTVGTGRACAPHVEVAVPPTRPQVARDALVASVRTGGGKALWFLRPQPEDEAGRRA